MAAAAAAAALGGEAYADSPKQELQAMHAKLKEAKSPSWVKAILEHDGPLTDQESFMIKDQARALAQSDELQLLLTSLNQLIDAGKMKKGEAVSMFMDVTKDIDSETLEVKVTGVGTTKSELSDAVANAIRHTEKDGHYKIVTPDAPDAPAIAGTSMTQALAKATTKRTPRKK